MRRLKPSVITKSQLLRSTPLLGVVALAGVAEVHLRHLARRGLDAGSRRRSACGPRSRSSRTAQPLDRREAARVVGLRAAAGESWIAVGPRPSSRSSRDLLLPALDRRGLLRRLRRRRAARSTQRAQQRPSSGQLVRRRRRAGPPAAAPRGTRGSCRGPSEAAARSPRSSCPAGAAGSPPAVGACRSSVRPSSPPGLGSAAEDGERRQPAEDLTPGRSRWTSLAEPGWTSLAELAWTSLAELSTPSARPAGGPAWPNYGWT